MLCADDEKKGAAVGELAKKPCLCVGLALLFWLEDMIANLRLASTIATAFSVFFVALLYTASSFHCIHLDPSWRDVFFEGCLEWDLIMVNLLMAFFILCTFIFGLLAFGFWLFGRVNDEEPTPIFQ